MNPLSKLKERILPLSPKRRTYGAAATLLLCCSPFADAAVTMAEAPEGACLESLLAGDVPSTIISSSLGEMAGVGCTGTFPNLNFNPPGEPPKSDHPFHSFRDHGNLSDSEMIRHFSDGALFNLGEVLTLTELGHPGAAFVFDKGKLWRKIRVFTGATDDEDRETHQVASYLHEREEDHIVKGRFKWAGSHLKYFQRIKDAQGFHYYEEGVSHGCVRIPSMDVAREFYAQMTDKKGKTRENSVIVTKTITPEMMDAAELWARYQPDYPYYKLSKDEAPSIWPLEMLERKLSTLEARKKKLLLSPLMNSQLPPEIAEGLEKLRGQISQTENQILLARAMEPPAPKKEDPKQVERAPVEKPKPKPAAQPKVQTPQSLTPAPKGKPPGLLNRFFGSKNKDSKP